MSAPSSAGIRPLAQRRGRPFSGGGRELLRGGGGGLHRLIIAAGNNHLHQTPIHYSNVHSQRMEPGRGTRWCQDHRRSATGSDPPEPPQHPRGFGLRRGYSGSGNYHFTISSREATEQRSLAFYQQALQP